jgi:hypothetical protein
MRLVRIRNVETGRIYDERQFRDELARAEGAS